MKRGAWLAVAGVVLFLLWWLFAFGSYYAIQKPFTLAQAAALTRTLWSLLAPALIALIGVALGRRILRAAGLSMGDRLERALWAAGVGLGALSLLMLALGLAGLLRGVVLIPLFLAGAAYALAEIIVWARRGTPRAGARVGAAGVGNTVTLSGAKGLARCFAALSMTEGRRFPLGLRLYLGLLGGLSLLIALAPPLGFDSLVYHLRGPQLYLQAGAIRPGLDLLHLNYPAQIEMLYTLALAIAGEGAAAPLHWLYGLLAGAAVFLIGRTHFGRRAGLLGLAVWASMPMVFVLAGWAYNDLALAFHLLLALQAILRWRAGRERRWLILAGLGVGLALGQKYTSAVGALALGLLVVWDTWRARRSLRSILLAGVAFAAPALLVAAPWYIKTWAFTGNPVYPFLFGGRFWDGFRAAWYQRAGTGLGWDLKEWLILPWSATVGLRDGNPYDGQIGPLLLVLLPAFLLAPLWLRRRPPAWRRAAGPILWVAGALALVWTAGVISSRSLWQMRLLLPALILLCPLAGACIEASDLRLSLPFSLRRLLIVSVGLVLVASAVSFTLRYAAINPLPALLGAETRQSYLERNLGYHALAMEQLAESLPAQSKTLFLYETRAYYATRPAEGDVILDRWARLVHAEGEAGAIAAALREAGCTHILVHRLGRDFLRGDAIPWVSDRDLEVWEAFTAGYLRAIEWPGEPAYELYALRDP